jgi:paraquat-inducible protein B
MAKEANKTLIGAFVVGATVLTAATILVLGGGKIFQDQLPLVTYFEGSVKGLGIGSKVQLKGVTVGEVRDVRLLFHPQKLSFINRVYILANPGVVGSYFDPEETAPPEAYEQDMELVVASLINRGLRARLEMESIVTGKLLVALDFYPESPVELRGLEPDLIEIPTVQTELEKITKTLGQLPLEEIVFQAKDTLQGINSLVRSPELREALQALNQTLQHTEELAKNLDEQLGPLLADLDDTVRDFGKLARSVDAQVTPVAESITDTARDADRLVKGMEKQLPATIDSLQKAIAQFEVTLQSIETMTEEDSVLQIEVNNALVEIKLAARAIRQLANYLDRHPEALLQGKSAGSGG